MTNVTIHGKLGKIYGKNHKFKIRKMSEIIPAINANSPGFKHKILGDFNTRYFSYSFSTARTCSATNGIANRHF
jgi:predicted phage tail protein